MQASACSWRFHLKLVRMHLQMYCWNVFSLEKRGLRGIQQQHTNTYQGFIREMEPCSGAQQKDLWQWHRWKQEGFKLHVRKTFLHEDSQGEKQQATGEAVLPPSLEVFPALTRHSLASQLSLVKAERWSRGPLRCLLAWIILAITNLSGWEYFVL